jgi:leucyl aminopeptidase (aminopeptidase T)
MGQESEGGGREGERNIPDEEGSPCPLKEVTEGVVAIPAGE